MGRRIRKQKTKTKNAERTGIKKRLLQEYFDQLFRVSKNQIIWGGNYFDKHLYLRLVGFIGIKTTEKIYLRW
jgi:hypothetical protein